MVEGTLHYLPWAKKPNKLKPNSSGQNQVADLSTKMINDPLPTGGPTLGDFIKKGGSIDKYRRGYGDLVRVLHGENWKTVGIGLVSPYFKNNKSVVKPHLGLVNKKVESISINTTIDQLLE
jgi:hypothetical protein